MIDGAVESTREQAYAITDGGCFGCGQKNPIGLRLRFDPRADGVVQAEYLAPREYQGYSGVVHGGIVATILDEALGWAVIHRHGRAVTGEWTIRHRHPVPVEQRLVITGRVLRQRLSLVEAEAEIEDTDGTVLAQARGKFMLVSQASEVV